MSLLLFNDSRNLFKRLFELHKLHLTHVIFHYQASSITNRKKNLVEVYLPGGKKMKPFGYISCFIALLALALLSYVETLSTHNQQDVEEQKNWQFGQGSAVTGALPPTLATSWMVSVIIWYFY
ncbi:hypothetical protein HanPI659440_Chr16g0639601 [Helianthus annuus]|nr:hypothetical protein HanPI659440_Chr16g0639601 [Helianthus annuus]